MSTEKYKAKKSDFNNIFNQLSFPDGHSLELLLTFMLIFDN
jgi:hypothetical protein